MYIGLPGGIHVTLLSRSIVSVQAGEKEGRIYALQFMSHFGMMDFFVKVHQDIGGLARLGISRGAGIG